MRYNKATLAQEIMGHQRPLAGARGFFVFKLPHVRVE